MSDHHVRWSSFNGEHHYVDHIYYMINIVMFTIETTPSHEMIGHGLVDSDHVIT